MENYCSKINTYGYIKIKNYLKLTWTYPAMPNINHKLYFNTVWLENEVLKFFHSPFKAIVTLPSRFFNSFSPIRRVKITKKCNMSYAQWCNLKFFNWFILKRLENWNPYMETLAFVLLCKNKYKIFTYITSYRHEIFKNIIVFLFCTSY